MAALTIHEAAQTTGWSARMLRYVEQLGLVEPTRSASGYRLYGPAQLQRLRTLRELLQEHDLELGDVGLALRLRREPQLQEALDAWFSAGAGSAPDGPAPRPAGSPPSGASDDDWLAFEQVKHQQLLTSDRQDTA